jgi:DNA-binding NtrC family response regulator
MALPTVLLVDDDPQLLAAVGRNLRQLPVNLETAQSAEEAMAWLAGGGAPAMIISNQWMDGLNGSALLDWARKLQPGVRCVLHTGDMRVRSSEGITVLIKPTAPGILQNLVATICAS